jgi:hypothetical protein
MSKLERFFEQSVFARLEPGYEFEQTFFPT